MTNYGAKDSRLGAHGFTRREMIRSAGVLAGALVAGGALSSCSSSPGGGGGASTPGSAGSVALPTYSRMSVPGVTPDLPGNDDGVLDAFFAYPETLPSVTNGIPGAGGTLSCLYINSAVAPKPLDRNQWWQEMNRRLGVTLQVDMPPAADYTAKLATRLAGDDLPDLVELFPANHSNNPPQIDRVLEAKFADISDFVSGDAVHDYPALANLPTDAWRGVVFGGKIYGVPAPLYKVGKVLMSRRDIIDQKGLTDEIRDGDEFLELCRNLTDSQANHYAAAANILPFVMEMHGAPNGWANAEGKFTKDFETDEFKSAIEFMSQLWAEGLMHPDSYSGVASAKAWFGSAAVALYYDNFSADKGLLQQYSPIGMELGRVRPPKHDGNGWARKHAAAPTLSFMALRKAEPERIEEILRVIDWIASPFGTEEYLFTNSGIEGTHFEWKDGSPIRTETGTAEYLIYPSIGKAPWVIHLPGFPDDVRANHQYQVDVIPDAISDPTIGLTSPTALSKYSTLQNQVNDVAREVVQGRKSLDDLDAAVQGWRQSGGDAMRDEFQEAFQKYGA